jgi:FkbM family methyltransferase
MRVSSLSEILRNERHRAKSELEFILRMPPKSFEGLVQCFGGSKSQLWQDLFVLSELDFKRNGFFVEFGATNGIDLSNTYLLETDFEWVGILAEPARCWHSDLKRNRSAFIEDKCVWVDSTSTLIFNETSSPELSTIGSFSSGDLHRKSRESGKEYSVDTISLNDLLVKYNAPNQIDYLSIDTEGSEFAILSSLNFEKYTFKVITCEHAYTKERLNIQNLLESHGYVRKYEELSAFDDWYVRESS